MFRNFTLALGAGPFSQIRIRYLAANMKIINERLSYYQRKLEIIETAMNTEMQKEHRARNYRLLNFLAKERDVFRYVSSEVRLIVEGMGQPLGDN